MPGNEVGDRIHNFFGQENLSQVQHHSQVVDGTWPGLSNNLWVGNQRQIGAPLISNLKNYNIQQPADSERGHGGQSSSLQHGLNFTQSPLRPEFTRSQSQNQHPTLNGFVHGQQAFQTRQNEANFLGVDTESDRHNLTSRGLSVLDSQLGNGPELKKNSVRLETTESPVNYDFFGGQQQLSGQHPGMLQPLPRQQSGISDMQLLHQQVMHKQMQEFQRQQQLQKPQFQQQEVRQLSSISPVSSIAQQAASNHSPALINGIPIHDSSNYSLQPELMAANTHWLQRGASPVMQGSSSGLMFSPEQGQALRLMGMVPQQVDQSLYGVPITSTRGIPSQHSPIQMDKPTMQQVPANSSSFPGNQYAAFPDEVSMQGGTLVSRQGFQRQNMFGPAAGQSLNSGVNLENLQQVNPQQRNEPVQEFRGRQELAGPSEMSHEKMGMQVPPSQNVATLDPTEEKILFGSDDNLWDAFGGGTNMGSGGFNMLDGMDPFGALPSMQSGSWSALMQSAVAETSSSDVGQQEEWSGLSVRDGQIPTRNQPPSTVNDGSKQQSAWANNNLQAASAPISRPFPLSDDANASTDYCSVSGVQKSGSKTLHEQVERLQTNSSQGFVQKLPEEGSKWLDRSSLQKPIAGRNNFYGNIAHSSDAEPNVKSIAGSWTQQQSMSSYNPGGQPCGPNGWNFIESMSPGGGATLQPSQSGDHKSIAHEEVGRVNSSIGSPQVNREDSDFNNVARTDSGSIRSNQESSQQHPNLNNLNFWKNVDLMNSRGSGLPGNYQHHLDKRPQIESSGNNGSDKGAVEIHDMENSNMKENSSDSFRSNVSHHGLRENVWLDASDSRTLPGGKQKSSGQTSRKPPVTRKFQYHPMGDLDVDAEPSYGTKQVTHSQTMPQQVPQGFKGHDQGYFGQSKFLGHFTRNSIETEKGHLPGFQGDTKGLDEVPSNSLHPGFVPGTSDRSVGNYAPNKIAPSSQNMLELLHKVDQSGSAAHMSSSDHNQSSEMPEAETSDGSVGHFQQNQASSQGFGLQLGPPSQRLSIPDRALISQSSSQTINSQTTTHVSSEVGGKGQSWLPPTASVQSLPPSREMSQGEFRNNISGITGQTSNKALQYNIQGNFSAAFTSGYPYSRSPLQNQHMSGAGGQVTSQSVNVSLDRSTSQLKQIEDSCERSQTSQSALASVPDMSKGAPHNDIASSAEISQSSINNQNHARDSAQQFPVLEALPAPQPSVKSGMLQQGSFPKMLPNVWTSVSTQQRSLGAKPSKAPSNLFKSHLHSNSNVETTSSGPQNLDDQIAQRGGNASSEFGACSANSQGYVGKEQPAKEKQESPENNAGQETASVAHLQGKESAIKRLSDASPSNPSSTQRDIEAFGRSLRPSNVMNQNYSLLHQVQAMKSTEIDPGNRSVKRFKGPDSGLDAQQVAPKGGQQLSYGSNTMVRDASTNLNSIPSADSRMLSFSSKPEENLDTNASSHDMLAFSRNDSQSFSSGNSAAAVRGEHSQISPQMAPSWFDQYGAFKNGQILSMYDARKIANVKTMEQPLIVGRPSDSLHGRHSSEQVIGSPDAGQLGNVWQSSSPTTIANEHFSSPQLLPPDITDQSLVIVRPKKRKSATSELLPWHREVMQGSQRHQNLSAAEVEWAQAANRPIEKVEDEAELIEDGPPMFRSKRRLILTTQLMQQLLRPPPSAVLSADASAHYENVAYFVSRSVLGDACSTVSYSGSDTPVTPKSGNLLHEKVKTSERIGDQYMLKAMEDFVGRAKKLENELLRLDKRASILDLRVECQDLEKFSVINRFAKFHGRGQADGAETSSSSDATANTQKSCPQRYVTAVPMPRNLPDRVQCLSL